MSEARRSRFPSFGVQVLIGLALGVVLGFIARGLGEGNALGTTLQTVGAIFVQLLRALVPPLVFTAIVASIAALKDLNNATRLVVQTLLWFAITNQVRSARYRRGIAGLIGRFLGERG